jgi:hypothetical protein
MHARIYIRKPQIRELLPHSLHKLLANLVLKIKLLILVPLLHSSVPANRAHIDHAVPELDKRASLDRDIQIRNIVQDEAHELLVVVLADPLDERVRRERHAHADRGQAVLGEAEVEEVGDGDARGAELFLLLGEVGAADEADGDFVAEGGEELEHLGGDRLKGEEESHVSRRKVETWVGGLGCAHSSCGCEGSVDIEEADRVLDRALGERRDDAGGSSGGGHYGGAIFLFVYVSLYACTVCSSRVLESCVVSWYR